MLNLLSAVTIAFLLVGTGENQWPEWKNVDNSLLYVFRCRPTAEAHSYECQLKRNDGEPFSLTDGKCFFFDVGPKYQDRGRFCPTGDKLPFFTVNLSKTGQKPRRCALAGGGDAPY
jgi:hypothetical protein